MEVEALKLIIKTQKEAILRREEGVKRDLLNDIEEHVKFKEAIILTGVRRCGKSTLLFQTMRFLLKNNVNQDNILYVNFEDERLISFEVSDFEHLYQAYLQLYVPKGRIYVFLDEIQNVENWEKWVNRMLEFEDIRIFVTGSNSSLIKSDVSAALTGRNVLFEEFPMSFREFAGEVEPYTSRGLAAIRTKFEKYIGYGGFPEVILKDRKDLIYAYLGDIINRDILRRYEIRNTKRFEEFAMYAVGLYGKNASFSKLQKVFNLGSPNTAKLFLSYLENAYLLFTVDNYSSSKAEIIRSPKKIYAVDHALAAAASNNPLNEKSNIMENITFIELIRRLGKTSKIYYWRDYKQREIDFVVKQGSKITELIQVTYTSSGNKLADREIDNLLIASEDLLCNNLLVITWDYEAVETVKGKKIKFIPLWKWLLDLN